MFAPAPRSQYGTDRAQGRVRRPGGRASKRHKVRWQRQKRTRPRATRARTGFTYSSCLLLPPCSCFLFRPHRHVNTHRNRSRRLRTTASPTRGSPARSAGHQPNRHLAPTPRPHFEHSSLCLTHIFPPRIPVLSWHFTVCDGWARYILVDNLPAWILPCRLVSVPLGRVCSDRRLEQGQVQRRL